MCGFVTTACCGDGAELSGSSKTGLLAFMTGGAGTIDILQATSMASGEASIGVSNPPDGVGQPTVYTVNGSVLDDDLGAPALPF